MFGFKSKIMIHFKTNLLPDPTYYFGHDITAELGPLLKQHVFDRVYFITSDLLLGLYGKETIGVFEKNDVACEVVKIKDSENDKTFANLEYLCESLVAKGITKGSIIIGFDGGCLTNIVGLAAGMIFRGIRYVEMPTTLMGVTDSTLSNKQAVNGKQGVHHHEIPGEGDIDFERIVHLIKQSGYEHFVSVELHHHDAVWQKALKESRDYLLRLIQCQSPNAFK